MNTRRFARIIKVAIRIGCAGLFSYGCNDAECPLNNVVYARYGFYADGERCALTDTLTVRACGTDSILLNMELGVSTMALPMSYYNPVDTLVLEYVNKSAFGRDTIYVEKENMPHYESPDCPTSMFHAITNVRCSHQWLDDIELVNRSVGYGQDENIKIHIRVPDTDGV